MFSFQHAYSTLEATAEVMNDIAKTLWSLGYFLPLVRQTSTDERAVGLTG
jgi:hypothetical protein